MSSKPEKGAEDTEEQRLAAQPHDAYFKKIFSDSAHATTFFRNHLPEEVIADIRWESLALAPASYVKRSLLQSHSDLLFSVQSSESKDSQDERLLYLVFEHQTTPDPRMPLRLLAYQIEILLDYSSKNPGKSLPPIICYVLNQGPAQWKISTQFEDMFALPGGNEHPLADYIPKFRHVLFDLTTADPKNTETDPGLRIALQLMKLARTKELLQFFEWLIAELQDAPEDISTHLIRSSLLYAFINDGSLDVEEIAQQIESSPDPTKAAMSLAEQLIAKGEAEGKAQGKAEGVLIGKIELLVEMLGKKSISPAELSSLSLDQLQKRYQELDETYKAKFKRA